MQFLKKKKEQNVETEEANVYVPDSVVESGDNRPADDLADGDDETDSTDAENPVDAEDEWSSEEANQTKIKKPNNNKTLFVLIAAFAALVAAGGIFIWMLSTWKTTQVSTAEQVRATTATVQVITTTKAIPQFTNMTMDEINGTMQYIKVYADAVPEGAITDPSKLVGLTTNHEIAQNAILTEKDFTDYGNSIDDNTIEISFPVEELTFAVAGNTVPGNKIVLGYIDNGVFTEFYETTIYKMYNENGVSVDSGASATMFTVLVPRTDASSIYSHIQQGTMVIEKTF